MKRSLSILFISTIFTSSASDSYSLLKGDTLYMGNSRIERVFLWNDGNLITRRVTDKLSGKTFESDSKSPDFVVNKAQPSEGRFSVETMESDGIKPGCLVSTVSFSSGDLDVERRYRIYDGVPAIAVDTRLKGNYAESRNKTKDNADLSNIERASDMKSEGVTTVLDRVKLKGNHWKGRAVEFRDVTDWNNNLVEESDFICYRKRDHRGNLLFLTDLTDRGGLIFLKEAPCSNVQLAYGRGDFVSDFSHFMVTGLGVANQDISADKWTPTYSSVMISYGDDELSALKALRNYQKTCRILDPGRDEMIMMNTWGDRSQDAKVNERFCLAELEKAADLGVTVFQIDDGWQCGKSANSVFAGGSFKNIHSNPDYWKPDPEKYPRGLRPIMERGRELGIEVGLWFNPSIQDDFADWEKDAQSVIDLWRDYGIRIFKIDGLTITSKSGEENLRKMFDRILEHTDNQVIFNLDATASRRLGYHFFNEYGNIFLENRYTDWGNYYPYQTLRNLWQLAKYIPAEKLQVEFLNKWRNADKYPDDPYAPQKYSFPYLFAVTMPGQPLAWMEASNLPEDAFGIKGLVEGYKEIQHEFHRGVILPVGDEPSGSSWTGFQSITDDRHGFLLVFREATASPEGELHTWFKEGDRILLTPLLDKKGVKAQEEIAGRNGRINVKLDSPNDFVMYRYSVK
ncbi:MAG: alpha-galactosidase [Bacteroides sp.]|nr:alpha-galactosidase [Bacteroides sp.]